MIARELRLTSPVDFERVRANGRSWSSRHVIAIVAANQLETNRYGVAAARRIGNAVHRNRAKRLLRESIRLLHTEIESGFDIVFIARANVSAETKMQEVCASMRQALEQANLVAPAG